MGDHLRTLFTGSIPYRCQDCEERFWHRPPLGQRPPLRQIHHARHFASAVAGNLLGNIPRCPRCGAQDLRRERLEGLRRRLVANVFGADPWECPYCRTVCMASRAPEDDD